jgi:hypothetical protein
VRAEPESPARLGHGVRLATAFLRSGAPNDDVLELLDSLWNLVLDYFEVGRGEVGDGRAVARRVHIHADVVGFGAEGRLWELILCGQCQAGRHGRSGDAEPDCGQRSDTRSLHLLCQQRLNPLTHAADERAGVAEQAREMH